MPDKHWVLVAERRGVPSRERHREIIYATDDKAQAVRDAELMARETKSMRYYVMHYQDMYDVAPEQRADLERALSMAKLLREHRETTK